MSNPAVSDKKKASFLLRLGEAVSGCSSLDTIMDDVVGCLTEYIGIDAACLYITHGRSCTLSWAFGIGKDFAESRDIRSLRQSSSGALLSLRQSVVTHVPPGEHPSTSFAGKLDAIGLTYAVWVPVIARSQALGVLALARSKDSNDFSEDCDDLLLAVGRQLGMALTAVCNSDLITRLHDAERRHRDLYEDMPAMYVAVDADGIITDCNTLVQQILGYTNTELVGQPIQSLIPGYSESLAAAKEGENSANGRVRFEETIKGSAGHEHDILVSCKLIEPVHGERPDAILILEDVTEKNRLESENLYKSMLVDNSTDSMFVRAYDDNATIVYANEVAWKSRGYTEEEFLKLLPHQIGPKELKEQGVLDRLHDLFVYEGGYDVTFPHIHKDGSLMEMEISSRRLIHRGRLYATIITRDVTERNKLQRELERATRFESLGRLAAGLAHDFNNMLVGIMGHSSLLKAQSKPGTQSYKSAETIEKTASHAARIVSRLMIFARGEEPKLEMISLNEIVDDIVDLLAGTLPSNIKVVKAADDERPHMKADKAQFMQCVLNLCLNARDAMPDGGTLYVKAFVEDVDHPVYALAGSQWLTPGRYAAFTVRDTGIGMDDETVHRVFEPYFTTKDTSEGHGFGLATTYGIVRRHGGYINVKSQPGGGSRFTMFFPAVDPPQETPKEEPSALHRAGGAILVIEDDETVREFLDIALTKAGYEVVMAADGEEGIRLFSSRKDFGVVIVDLIMPGLPGEEVCDKLHAIDPAVRLLVSSGYSNSDRKIEHARGYLQKPYQLQELFKAVASASKEQ